MKIVYRSLRIRHGQGIFHNIRRQLCGKIFTRARNSYSDLKLSWGVAVFGRACPARLSIFSFQFHPYEPPFPPARRPRFPRIYISPRKCQIPYTDRNSLSDREHPFFADAKHAGAFFSQTAPTAKICDELISRSRRLACEFHFGETRIRSSRLGLLCLIQYSSWLLLLA